MPNVFQPHAIIKALGYAALFYNMRYCFQPAFINYVHFYRLPSTVRLVLAKPSARIVRHSDPVDPTIPCVF